MTMDIQALVSQDTWPVRAGDTVEQVAEALADEVVGQLPVVDEEERLIGLIGNWHLDSASPTEAIKNLVMDPPVSIGPDAHMYEAANMMVQRHLSVLPVTDLDKGYLGLLKRDDLFARFADGLATSRTGAILEVEMATRDYTIGRLVHAIEQSDVKILSLATDISDLDGGQTRVTVKLNANDATRVRHMLEHYGYRVAASFNDLTNDEDLQRRVEELMRYLEV